jgi:hypothetical protein
MDDFDHDCEDRDLHCPPPVLSCTCPCHRLKPTVAEVCAGYVMLFGFTALMVWILHTLACTH